MPDQTPRPEDWVRELATGDPELDQFLLQSLQAGLGGNPEVAQAILDRSLQNDARVELHLLGDAESRHLSRADLVGRLLNRAAVSVKALAKDIGGLKRHSTGLWVEAPASGSMKLVMRTVEPRRPGDDTPLPATYAPSLDAQALVAMCVVLNQASMPSEDSPLYATVIPYRGETRAALATMCRVVQDAGWRIEGNVAVAGRRPAPVVFDASAAARVIDAATLTDNETVTEQVTGIVDGWSWSRGTMDFIPGTGRAFTASVGRELHQPVADLTASHRHTRATLSVTTSYPQGDRRSAVRSRILTGIEELPIAEQDQLPT